MLTLWGGKTHFCDGMLRRTFLRIGAFGAGLMLGDLLRLRARAGAGASTSAKSAIMIYLGGGPSHLDTYDLKPDAPRDIRGTFQPIATNVPGVRICEHLPLQAKMFDKLAVIRSIASVDADHSDAAVMTGYGDGETRKGNHPSFGAVVAKVRGPNAAVPPFVSLRGPTRGTEPGYLGMAYRPFTPSGRGLQDLSPADGVSRERLQRRKALLEGFDDVRRDLDASGTMSGLDAFTARAFDMVFSGAVRNALDLKKEDPKTRARYQGLEQVLTARRLIEAGAGCVTLCVPADDFSWDTHQNNFAVLTRLLPQVDRAVANLIQDLHDRGLDQDVVTIMWGEFGRTPRINGAGGRDHWPQVMSALIAGGGLHMGQAVGASNAYGEYPREARCTPSRVLSTIYHALGINPAQTFQAGSSRSLLSDREPIAELL